jgi:deoxyribose-phosphate aldolase
VNSRYIPLANSLLGESDILVVSVIGFPLGACLTQVKRDEAQWAATEGADELDMVINIGAVKDSDWKYVERDIRSVTESVSLPVKVILETGLLTKEEIVRASLLAEAAGARFVKTCTGFAAGAATVEDVELMRATVSELVEVKASGGIKTTEQARALIHAGATRLGTSSGVQLVTGKSVAAHAY